jgi:phosphoribosylformylglycinamidine cyclo-ligase
VEPADMARVFNMGIGLVLVVSPYYATSIRHQLSDCGLESFLVGKIAGK